MEIFTRKFLSRLILSATAGCFFLLINLRCTVDEVNISPYPVVKIISPTPTTHILDTATIQVQASDDKGVTRVEIYIDGKLAPGGKILYVPYQYNWDTSALTDSSVHEIYAKAYNVDSNSTTSSTVAVTVYKFQPSNLVANLVGDTLVALSWTDNCSKETGYEVIERVGDSLYYIAAQLPANTTSAGVPGIYSTTQYYTFYARAVIDSLKSKFSNGVTVLPVVTAPSQLTATMVADTLVMLSWQNRLHPISQYIEVDQAENDGPFTIVGNISAALDSTSLKGSYVVGTFYRYRLRGWTVHNNYSLYSNISSTQVVFPAPSSLTENTVDQFSVQIRWTDNSSFEKGFSIERKTPTADFAEVGRVGPNVTSFIDTGLDSTMSYIYRVRAFTDLNASGYSGLLQLNYQFNYFEEQSIQADGARVGGLAFVGTSNDVISVGTASSAKMWDASNGTLIKTFSGSSAPLTSLAVNPQGTMLITGSANGNIIVWDIPSASATLSIPAYPVPITSVSVSPDGQYIASSSTDSSTIKVWRVSDGSLLWTVAGHTSLINATCYSPDGTELFSCSDDQHVKTWNALDGSLLRDASVSFNYFKSLATNSAANMVAAGSVSQSNSLTAWQLTTGTQLSGFTPNGSIPGAYAVAFSADGTSLVCGYDDYFVRVWSVSNRSLVTELYGHRSQVHAVAFNKGADLMASGSSDGILKIWRWKKLWH
ncbi:MAG TPA: Ig-like domain-containing protein [Bacteroidota bacterium]|nr:Ig-like domain-containing protein [Bacteroidota bacterium]